MTESPPVREHELAVAAYRAMYGERAVEAAPGVTVLRAPEAPRSPLLNRVLGLGVAEPATSSQLDAALTELTGATAYVAVEPGPWADSLESWLRERAFEPGWGWMRFRRDLAPYEPAPSELEVVEVGPAEAPSFARIVATGYDLPDETLPWLAEIASTGWLAWLALADGEPAAAAALYVSGRGAYLGFAATLPAHRSLGAQNALLAARIERARELGCTWLATETGELRDDRPSASYRNLLRCGFVEQTIVANWVGRA